MEDKTASTPNLDNSSNISTLPEAGPPTNNVPLDNPKPIVNPPSSPRPKKKVMLVAGLISAILFLGLGIFVVLSRLTSNIYNPVSNISPTPFLFKAKVVYLSGVAYKLDGDRKVEIKENDILDEKTTVVTDAGTRLTLSLDEGSVVRLGEKTQITLSTLTSPLTSVSQESGFVFFRVQKDESHKFVVLAGNVTVESLGTAYSVEKEDEVKVKVFEDTVKVVSEETETEVTKNEEWTESEKEVTKIDTEKLATNEFYQWSLKEEGLEETTQPQEKELSEPTGQYIKLSGEAIEGGIKLSWKTVDVEPVDGFKIIMNKAGNPTYPGDDARQLNRETFTYFWENLNDGQTYHFRVCQYLGENRCGVYSNDLAVTASSTTSER